MYRVLGIDPGLRITGYGLLAIDLPDDNDHGSRDISNGVNTSIQAADTRCASRSLALLREPRLLEAGVIRLDSKLVMEARLDQLHRELVEVIQEHQPQCLVVEKLFAHYNHPRTAILMGHARGVILLAARQHNLPVTHLPATEVKKAVTGYGRASKQQIQRSIQCQFNLPTMPSPPDVADALAIALAASRRMMMNAISGTITE